ncbi:MAG: hypothetical protein M3516_09170 [Actinomycetota bacterium]|nr:hypothetical protein [Actinomycetota bacterium]
MRCPHCGGLNPRDAEWCGQCLTSFVAQPVTAGQAAPASAPPRPAYVPGAGNPAPPVHLPGAANGNAPVPAPENGAPRVPGADHPRHDRVVGTSAVSSNGHGRGTATDTLPKSFKVTDSGISWACRMCETENPLAVSTCSVCGSTFAQTLKEPEEKVIKRDPGTVTLISMFLPGAGHAYLGLWPQAIARAVISFLVVAVTVLAAVAPGSQSKALAGVFFMVSFGWWAVTAHDAYREATHRHYAVILKDRSFLFVVLGILLLLTAMVVVTLAGAR